MTEAEELAVLYKIVKKVRSPMWWARLSYPTDSRYWTDQEQEVLQKVR